MKIDNTFRENPLLTLILKTYIYMKITEAKNYFIFESSKQVMLNFKRKWQKLLAGAWRT